MLIGHSGFNWWFSVAPVFQWYCFTPWGSWAFVKFCVCPSFLFGIEGGMWDVIVLIPDHCLTM